MGRDKRDAANCQHAPSQHPVSSQRHRILQLHQQRVELQHHSCQLAGMAQQLHGQLYQCYALPVLPEHGVQH